MYMYTSGLVLSVEVLAGTLFVTGRRVVFQQVRAYPSSVSGSESGFRSDLWEARTPLDEEFPSREEL